MENCLGNKIVIRTHYLPMYIPDAHKPILRGYNVWAWMGHVLLGEIHGSHIQVKTKVQAQKTARKLREWFNESKEIAIPCTWLLNEDGREFEKGEMMTLSYQ